MIVSVVHVCVRVFVHVCVRPVLRVRQVVAVPCQVASIVLPFDRESVPLVPPEETESTKTPRAEIMKRLNNF